MKNYEEGGKRAIIDVTGGGEALTAAKAALRTEAEKEADERKRTLHNFGMTSCSRAQAEALSWFLARCFFVCVIPFMVVENWAFVAMVAGMAPAFAKLLPSRRVLSMNWLPKIQAETEEMINARLAGKSQKTVIIDGYKDVRKRHVLNIAWGVRGFVAYRKTAWFGRRRHTGDVHGEEVESALGDDVENTVACVADNTSSMSSLTNGLFGYLSRKFPRLFLIGCPVHVHDLIQEDIVKLPFVAEAGHL
jgi:hypothetical protein